MNKKNSSSRPTAKAKPYPRWCSDCGKIEVMATTIPYDAKVKHDGKLHKFHIPKLHVDRCQSCGEETFTNTTCDQISAHLRSAVGLLQPKDIRQQLRELGISQREFAKQLRIAPETVSRWMTGVAIQNRALDTLMRIYFAFSEVRKALPKLSRSKRLSLNAT